MQIPINIEKLIQKLLIEVPKEHLIGLDAITLVDHLTYKGNKKSSGLYWPRKGHEQAKIELAVNTIYSSMPRFVFFLPFVAKFMLAAVLYHEIGHHYQYFTHGVTRKAEQNFADKYKKRMLKKTFFWWRLVMLPLSPLVNLLNRVVQKKKKDED
jgi:hypothetical protein